MLYLTLFRVTEVKYNHTTELDLVLQIWKRYNEVPYWCNEDNTTEKALVTQQLDVVVHIECKLIQIWSVF